MEFSDRIRPELFAALAVVFGLHGNQPYAQLALIRLWTIWFFMEEEEPRYPFQNPEEMVHQT